MNAVPTISAHTARDLQPPRFPGHISRHPTREAVGRICARVAAEHDLTLNNVLYGYGKPHKVARRIAFKAVLAETGCSISGLSEVLGYGSRTAVYRAIGYFDQAGRVSA